MRLPRGGPAVQRCRPTIPVDLKRFDRDALRDDLPQDLRSRASLAGLTSGDHVSFPGGDASSSPRNQGRIGQKSHRLPGSLGVDSNRSSLPTNEMHVAATGERPPGASPTRRPVAGCSEVRGSARLSWVGRPSCGCGGAHLTDDALSRRQRRPLVRSLLASGPEHIIQQPIRTRR